MNLKEMSTTQINEAVRVKAKEAQSLIQQAFQTAQEANIMLQEVRLNRKISVHEPYKGAMLEVVAVNNYGLFVYHLGPKKKNDPVEEEIATEEINPES